MFTISHRFVYGLIAGVYAGSCFGLHHEIVAALIALSYLVLALTCETSKK